MATAFNDCGGENRSSRSISQQRRIDWGQPADEITSEEHRYGRTNELSEMVEEKLVLSRSPAPGIQTALIWNQSVNYSTLIQAPAAGAACWEAIMITAALLCACFKLMKAMCEKRNRTEQSANRQR